jgi:hypothetical protein
VRKVWDSDTNIWSMIISNNLPHDLENIGKVTKMSRCLGSRNK